MASDTDRKAMTPAEKHEEMCTIIEKLTNMLTTIQDALETINGDQ
jgi:hypothetical protein